MNGAKRIGITVAVGLAGAVVYGEDARKEASIPAVAAEPTRSRSAGPGGLRLPLASSAAEEGYRVLREKAFLPADFDDDVFAKLWTVWPEEPRERAATASPDELRRMTFERYGLHEPPDAPAGYDGPAIGYVDDGAGGWVMNCFACHAGRVAGRVVPGAPNTDIDLQSLVEDVRAVKLMQLKPLTHMDLGSLKLPLGGTRGTTNSVVFGIVLDGLRAPDMSVDLSRAPGKLDHHDMDAPAWWNVKKKSKLYVDGFAPKNHRILMQFMLIPKNDRETIYSWEEDFRDVLAYIESLEAPEPPWEIDEALAARGKVVFAANCAECHGTYREREREAPAERHGLAVSTPIERVLSGESDHAQPENGRVSTPLTPHPSPQGEGDRNRKRQGAYAARREPRPPLDSEGDTYSQRIVPIEELGTDPVRLGALSVKHRAHLATTWMTDYGRDETITDPGGYVAPPLDGVWATAPYFHNGSVPTLWHVLHPGERPKVWRRDRSGEGYDRERVGSAVEELEAVPKGLSDSSARREVFDTSRRGKSAAGHEYPDALSEEEKGAVLEYLRTL